MMANSNPWDERYGTVASGEYYYGKEPNDFLRDFAGAIPAGGEVLCLAEGEGRNAVYLASKGYRVTAVDASIVGLEKLAALALEKGVEVRSELRDLMDYRIEPNRWDAVVSVWCHLPRPLRARLHGELASGLKPAGVFLLEAYHPRQLEFKTGGPPSVELLVTAEDLRAEVGGLSFEVLREIEREVHEGRGHFGQSAVVQLLARKKAG
jgi:SAM-dependent methyltransferase